MENYTKYKLKSSDELTALLADKDNLFVIACNKCFKEFETMDEPDCGEFEKLAAECGKTITGTAKGPAPWQRSECFLKFSFRYFPPKKIKPHAITYSQVIIVIAPLHK